MRLAQIIDEAGKRAVVVTAFRFGIARQGRHDADGLHANEKQR